LGKMYPKIDQKVVPAFFFRRKQAREGIFGGKIHKTLAKTGMYSQTITNNFGLNYLQLNLHYYKSAAFNMDEDKTDIAMLQEPWV
jgi:hypothetical protein